jgi:Kef-type K+ transport system membrane component KefB
MAFLAEKMGLADITGAYLAGIAFCNTRCLKSLETNVHELSCLFFTPIFLANIGIQTSFAGFNTGMLLFTAAFVIVSILSKLIGCGLGARICKYDKKESLQIGVGMIARGEVSFIVASKGIAAAFITSQLYPSIIVVVLVTVLVAPLCLKAAFGGSSKD